MTSNWEVVNVSDFNGAFEGQMPKEKNSQSLEDILGNLKKPKRPRAPPMPELEDSPNGFMVGFWWIGGCCRLYRLAVATASRKQSLVRNFRRFLSRSSSPFHIF